MVRTFIIIDYTSLMTIEKILPLSDLRTSTQVFRSNLKLGCHRLLTADARVTQRADHGSD
jgi:hypothetical protein